jgi:hypothetical protein
MIEIFLNIFFEYFLLTQVSSQLTHTSTNFTCPKVNNQSLVTLRFIKLKQYYFQKKINLEYFLV